MDIMLKNIYNILSILLLFTACTSEDISEEVFLPTEGEMITLSFSVDAPKVAEITKAIGNTEKSVENLFLYTFDENGNFLSPVVTANLNVNGYTAVIQKTTRIIHFVANDGSLKPASESEMASMPIDKQIFWGKRTFNVMPKNDLSNNQENKGNHIELIRNWAKINLSLSSEASAKLFDVSYMIYNEAKIASVGYIKEGHINVPSQTYYKPSESEAEFLALSKDFPEKSALYTFEHNNQDRNGAFIIVKARFGSLSSDFSYYKIDLAVKDKESHVTKVYDFIRNYAFKVNVQSVSRKGMIWKDVINPDVIADNNITASPIMEKYPNITYDGESLNVTNTTFIFTGSTNQLTMKATYVGKGQLSVSPDPDEEMSDVVVSGSLKTNPATIPSGTQTITITADIKQLDNNAKEEKIAFFYIIGGNLQRKIKLVLRPSYDFVNPRFENQAAGLIGTNEVSTGLMKDIWLKFSLGNIEEALYPIDCRIYTKKLYAVEPGVRLETTGEGDWCYVYTAQTPQDAERVINFRTNTQNEFEEDVVLKADLFNEVSGLAYTRVGPKTMSGTIKYKHNLMSNSQNIPVGSTISYILGNSSGEFEIDEAGKYSLDYPTGYTGNITFSYIQDGIVYKMTTPVNESSNKNIELTASVKEVTIAGKFYLYNTNSRNQIKDTNISISFGSGGIGSFSISRNGTLSNNVLVVPTEVTEMSLIYNSYYEETFSIDDLQSSSKNKIFPR